MCVCVCVKVGELYGYGMVDTKYGVSNGMRTVRTRTKGRGEVG